MPLLPTPPQPPAQLPSFQHPLVSKPLQSAAQASVPCSNPFDGQSWYQGRSSWVSHTSPASVRPLPHASSRQAWLQPSPVSRFPSSHSSLLFLMPLPHSSLQVGLQPSLPITLPSSHSSPESRSLPSLSPSM